MAARFDDSTLAILSGGNGTRMGNVPKAFLRLKGRSFIDCILDLRAAFKGAMIIANDPAPYASLELPVVTDVIPHRGAPGGVHAALSAAQSDWVFVAAVDQPMLTLPVVAQLALARTDDCDVVLYEAGGRRAALAAFYRRALAAPFAQKLSGEPSMDELLGSARVRALSEKDLRAVDPNLTALSNVNTPEDLQRLGGSRPSAR